jgi:hypothetical protein
MYWALLFLLGSFDFFMLIWNFILAKCQMS